MSMVNLFGFRIPTIMLLMYVINYNYEACGIAMFVSNTAAGIITFTLCLVFMLTIEKKEKYKPLFPPNELTTNENNNTIVA